MSQIDTARHTEAAFETVIEAHLLAHGYMPVDRAGYARKRAIFPVVAELVEVLNGEPA